jgi:hypothetical protein
MTEHRRRIDIVLDPEFIDGLAELSLEELRSRRELVDQVETELSYYRRLLHGRMDLLDFERRRRSGEETRSLIEALPEILTGGDHTGGGKGRSIRGGFAPDLEFGVGKRKIDRVLEDGFLANLPSIDDEELATIRDTLVETEHEISERRRSVHGVHDRLQAEITGRYADASS